jgi:SAM-dependent methyltransferase
MHVTYRKTCRICGSRELTKVIDLGDHYLQGSFVKPDKPMPPLRPIPMELVRCDPMRDENACGLLQMSLTVPPQLLYATYWYRSGTNETMRSHLKGIAGEAASLTGKGSVVALDIGCNDGTLLRYYPESFDVFGIDPSDVAKSADTDLTIIQDLFPSAALTAVLDGKRCDIITSIAMFYDLEEPLQFVQGVKALLNEDGIWIFEMSYMPAMLQMNSYDTVCHEHLEYYSFAVIERLLDMCDMKVVNVSFNDINGGSIRCYATHADCFKYTTPAYQEALAEVRRREFEQELETDKPYRHFQERINSHKHELSGLLKDLKRAGKTIHAYGASTKGNTILQWCGIDHTIIPYAADRNPQKAGARTIGTDVAIISEEESRAMNPDYYLVLPWHFRQEFLAREKNMLARGTKFIFPLPKVEIVGT